MMMAQDAVQDKLQALIQQVTGLFHTAQRAAEEDRPIHEVERDLWGQLCGGQNGEAISRMPQTSRVCL